MIGLGDLYQRRHDEAERGMVICHDCDTHYVPISTDGCPACYEKRHPRCTCGEAATCVVDIYVDGLLIERAPVCSEGCAAGSVDDARPPLIDTIVNCEDFQKIAKSAPCWCGLRETTTCDWCPACGTKE